MRGRGLMGTCIAGAFALGAACSPTRDLDFFPLSAADALGGNLPSSGGAMSAGGSSPGGQGGSGGLAGETQRDVLVHPFSSNSIWNRPLGAGAQFQAADLVPVTGRPMTANYSIIILRPDAPLVGVYRNQAAWSGGDRCPVEGELIFEIPMPDDYLLPSDSENNSLAALMPDGRTIKQAQPFARCEAGAHGTALVGYPNADLYGEGIAGATGGSGLSSLGGTLRVGELRPESGPIEHTLKISLSGENLMDCDAPEDCFRWPALRGDAGAPSDYTGSNPELTMGSLLALSPEVDIESLGLESEPGRILAVSLQTYGAYVANQTGTSVHALSTERGPDGDFPEQFESDWGYPFEGPSGTPWTDDVVKIFAQLSVVTNNAEDAVGGGGEPIVPLAPALQSPD